MIAIHLLFLSAVFLDGCSGLKTARRFRRQEVAATPQRDLPTICSLECSNGRSPNADCTECVCPITCPSDQFNSAEDCTCLCNRDSSVPGGLFGACDKPFRTCSHTEESCPPPKVINRIKIPCECEEVVDSKAPPSSSSAAGARQDEDDTPRITGSRTKAHSGPVGAAIRNRRQIFGNGGLQNLFPGSSADTLPTPSTSTLNNPIIGLVDNTNDDSNRQTVSPNALSNILQNAGSDVNSDTSDDTGSLASILQGVGNIPSPVSSEPRLSTSSPTTVKQELQTSSLSTSTSAPQPTANPFPSLVPFIPIVNQAPVAPQVSTVRPTSIPFIAPQPSAFNPVPSIVPPLPSNIPIPSNFPPLPTFNPTLPTVPRLPTFNPTLPTVPRLPTFNPTLPTVPRLPTFNPTLPTVPRLPTVNPTLPTVPRLPTVNPTPPTQPRLPTVNPLPSILTTLPSPTQGREPQSTSRTQPSARDPDISGIFPRLSNSKTKIGCDYFLTIFLFILIQALFSL